MNFEEYIQQIRKIQEYFRENPWETIGFLVLIILFVVVTFIVSGFFQEKGRQLAGGDKQQMIEGADQQIKLSTVAIQKHPNSYSAILSFTFLKNEIPGYVNFTATIQTKNQEQIIMFQVMPEFMHTDRFEQILNKGAQATTRVQMLQIYDIRLKLEVTGQTRVLIEGNHHLEPFVVNIK